MIIWLTGQPSSGKTTLANILKERFFRDAILVDGTQLTISTGNQNSTEQQRIANVEFAQKMSKYLSDQGHTVIVSMVSPYRWQREFLKAQMDGNLHEVYLYTSEARERDSDRFPGYEPPREDEDSFLAIDTGAARPLFCAMLINNFVRRAQPDPELPPAA